MKQLTARCQICGRRKRLKKGGLITKHYRAGRVCPGSSARPYEDDCSAMERAIAAYRATDEKLWPLFSRHICERRNTPFPAHLSGELAFALKEASRLEVRLRRWRASRAAVASPSASTQQETFHD